MKRPTRMTLSTSKSLMMQCDNSDCETGIIQIGDLYWWGVGYVKVAGSWYKTTTRYHERCC